jgi:hypothetical protein
MNIYVDCVSRTRLQASRHELDSEAVGKWREFFKKMKEKEKIEKKGKNHKKKEKKKRKSLIVLGECNIVKKKPR